MEVEVVVGVPRTLLVLVVCHTIDVATGLEPPLNVAVKVIGLLAQRVVSDGDGYSWTCNRFDSNGRSKSRRQTKY